MVIDLFVAEWINQIIYNNNVIMKIDQLYPHRWNLWEYDNDKIIFETITSSFEITPIKYEMN